MKSQKSIVDSLKNAEAPPFHSEKFASWLVENANDSIFVLARGGQILSANLQAERLLGFPREKILGRFYHEFLAPEDTQKAAGMVEKIHEGDPSANNEVRLRRPDGQIVCAEFSSVFAELEGKKVMVSIGRDLTDRKKADAERIRLASIVETSSDAIYGTDMEGRINVWNPAAEKLYGHGFTEIMGRSVTVIVASDGHQKILKLLESCKGGQAVPPFEAVHKHRNQERVDVSMSLSPLKDGQGRVTGISIIARDMTEQKRAEESLRKREEHVRQAQKMEAVGQLAAGIAHDFNNLLGVVSGNGEFLLSELPEGSPCREEVKEIQMAVQRCSSLTKQLLIFGRKENFQPTVLNLTRVIDQAGKMLHRVVRESIELDIKVEPDLKWIKADSVQIEQILMNLSANARDAMPQGGKLVIQARNVDFEETYQKNKVEIPAGAYVLISVSDTGVGMSAEVQNHVFEPFFTTKEAGKGTGLGLATVYGIVHGSGGHIWVYSEEGEGTTFNIAFPAIEPSTIVAPTPLCNSSIGGSETILLVEDEEALRKIISRTLQKQGYNVLQAVDGQDGLRMATLHSGQIQLLLTDTVMPKMSGKGLADIVQVSQPDVRVIFMSGYPKEVLYKQGVMDPELHLIQKPFSTDDLLLRIREALNRRLATAERE